VQAYPEMKAIAISLRDRQRIAQRVGGVHE
jgi:hypothetical protein